MLASLMWLIWRIRLQIVTAAEHKKNSGSLRKIVRHMSMWEVGPTLNATLVPALVHISLQSLSSAMIHKLSWQHVNLT